MDLRRDSLGFVIAELARSMRRSFNLRIQGSSLTHAQARALVYVAHHEGVRQVVLAEILEVQPITLTRLVDQLEKIGLVERRGVPGDRRVYQLYLTPRAAPHLKAIKRVVAAIWNDAVDGLDEQQVAVLDMALRKMRDNLTKR